MKPKFYIYLLLSVVLLAVGPTLIHAGEDPFYQSYGVSGAFRYGVPWGGGSVDITGYSGPGGDVVIPAVIAGYPVTGVGWSAFQNDTSLTKITIPDSVNSIFIGAFAGCTSLRSITIPDSVNSINSYAFERCTSLTSIRIPNRVSGIADGTFARCTSIKSITIPDSVTRIAEFAFDGCTSLTSVFFRGSPPSSDWESSIFSGADNVTVYYLPGTTGWGSWYANRPTALWIPVTVGAITLTPAHNMLQATESMTVEVILPEGANDSEPVTVQVVNQAPDVISLTGAVDNMLTLQYAVGGPLVQPVTVTGIADGEARLSASASGFIDGTSTLLVLPPTALFQTVYQDDFDTDSSAGWTVSQSSADTAAVFAYDYSADGIPSAPNSVGGTTSGLKLTANMADGAAAGLSASPNGQSFTGNYVLSFDLWMNANGPFPLGGTGSTEYNSAAVGLTASGLVWSGSAPAGVAWFSVSGEGGSSRDYRAWAGPTEQVGGPAYFAGSQNASDAHYTAVFPGGQEAPLAQQTAYAQQSGGLGVGTIGFAWREVVVEKIDRKVTWFIDGLPIASLSADGDGASVEGNIAVGYYDPFPSLSDNEALSFSVVDNVKVEAIPEPPAIARQPGHWVLKEGGPGRIDLAVSGQPTPQIQWYHDGTPVPEGNNPYLEFPTVTWDLEGRYWMVANNALGEVTSDAIVVLVSNVEPMRFPVWEWTSEGGAVTVEMAPTPFGPWVEGGLLPAGTTSGLYVETDLAEPTRFYRLQGDANARFTATGRIPGWWYPEAEGAVHVIEYAWSGNGWGNWVELTELTLPASPHLFLDTEAFDHPGAVYRSTPKAP